MTRRSSLVRLWLLFPAFALLLLQACGEQPPNQPRQQGSVLVASASNFVIALNRLGPLFAEQSGYSVEVVSGSTGKLYAQVKAGAPFDVFLAADQARPKLLHAEGLATQPFGYALGILVLWRPAGGQPLQRLRSGTVSRIALANPQLAPYGLAAEQTLLRLEADGIGSPGLVQGENVGQAHSMIATGNTELGFTALAYVLALPVQQRGAVWEVPAHLHEPIRQDGVLLHRASRNPAAIAFVEFLQSPLAREHIKAAGYELP